MPRRVRTRATQPAEAVPGWVLKFLATGEVDYHEAGLDAFDGKFSGTTNLCPITPILDQTVRERYLHAWAAFGGVFESHRAQVEALCAAGKKSWFENRLKLFKSGISAARS